MPMASFLIMARQDQSTAQLLSWLVSLAVAVCVLQASSTTASFFDPLDGSVDRSVTIREDMFRAVTAAAYRVEANKGWCYSSPRPKKSRDQGRKYSADDYAKYVSTLMDLYLGLGLGGDEPGCFVHGKAFKELVKSELSGGNIPERSWWEDQFLPLAAKAFTCGADVAAAGACTGSLPSDIRDVCETDDVIRAAWSLLKSYLKSPLKLREHNQDHRRRTDYDLSAYVPFLGKRVRVQGKAGMYQDTSNMRVGFPFFAGPSLWRIFHTIASRTLDFSDCTDIGNELVTAVKKMFLYFALAGQPCPYCREHFLSRVSRNDVKYLSVTLDSNEVTGLTHSDKDADDDEEEDDSYKIKSEANKYPIEWLVSGCTDGICPTDDSKIAQVKFDAVKTTKDLNLFIWKLHNTVTSSVADGKYCSLEEEFDFPDFKCNKSKLGTLGYPRSHRFWPFSKRYEFSLVDGSSSSVQWRAFRQDSAIKTAVAELAKMNDDMAKVRIDIIDGAAPDAAAVKKIQNKLVMLDEAFWPAFEKFYTTKTIKLPPSHCKHLKEHLAKQAGVPMPKFKDIVTLDQINGCMPQCEKDAVDCKSAQD